MKIEKRCFPENFDSCIANKFLLGHIFSDFTKKNEKGKEKVVFQGEDNTKGGCATSLFVGVSMSIINRIRRSKLKGKIVVEVGGNQKDKWRLGMGESFWFLQN